MQYAHFIFLKCVQLVSCCLGKTSGAGLKVRTTANAACPDFDGPWQQHDRIDLAQIENEHPRLLGGEQPRLAHRLSIFPSTQATERYGLVVRCQTSKHASTSILTSTILKRVQGMLDARTMAKVIRFGQVSEDAGNRPVVDAVMMPVRQRPLEDVTHRRNGILNQQILSSVAK